MVGISNLTLLSYFLLTALEDAAFFAAVGFTADFLGVTLVAAFLGFSVAL